MVKKTVYLPQRLIDYIEAIQEVENTDTEHKKSFSRVLSYLVVLGIAKYKKIYNIEPELFDTSFFDFDKRMGHHDYKVEPDLLALRREKLRKRLIELGRSFFEDNI